ncbi:MAG TPA: hypothetical protein VNO84_14425 [Burkholderiaceae bacterium]|nr:hypothetical protein [Burkholderiaceae bacterium]
MRRPASLEVHVRDHRLWRGAVLAAATVTLAGLAAWVGAAPTQWPLAVLAAALTLVCSWTAARAPAMRLRFDGQRWHWHPLARPARSASGHARVMLDLGGWLLLRLQPQTGQADVCWLPVDARDLPAQWHALRCAVYCRTPGDDPLAVSNSLDA